ncbi:MAG: ATP-dependent helicase HrpB, partial [Pseudomonadota bacterium]
MALPIEAVLDDVCQAMSRERRCVLEAPPGAGKTTRVPLALLESGIRGRILVLEPRRVAARSAAERLAEGLGEPLGQTVGLAMRGERVRGERIEVITEGLLTRMIQDDPELSGVGAVIFDEFHERSLDADLGLALSLEIRGALRPDLALMVMSATLDAQPVARLLDDAPRITSAGQAFPVETVWADRPAGQGRAREGALADLVLAALAETDGGCLVFLPGRAEIARAAAALGPRLPADARLMELHGGLPVAEQRRVLAPLATGRKVILSTAVAETSVTIPDIRVVVDAGLARRARFDPGTGMSRLLTERVTRAEAAQRAGRAGRVAAGRCYRLWTKGEDGGLQPFAPPEIETADLAGLALELAVWGAQDAAALPFLTPPRPASFAEARWLLTELGALGPSGHLTERGREMARVPAHPRLAAMVGQGGRVAADLAALLEARDILSGPGPMQADLALRLRALAGGGSARSLGEVRDASRRLRSHARGGTELSPGALLSLAYPDRIALRRPGTMPRYLLSGGSGAALDPADDLSGQRMLVAADLDGDKTEARIRRALPVSEADIRELHADRLEQRRIAEWSRRTRDVLVRERLMLGALILEDRPWHDADDATVIPALLEGIRDLGAAALPWTDADRRLQERLEWLRARGEAMPDLSDDGLLGSLEVWLTPWLAGCRRMADLAAV